MDLSILFIADTYAVLLRGQSILFPLILTPEMAVLCPCKIYPLSDGSILFGTTSMTLLDNLLA